MRIFQKGASQSHAFRRLSCTRDRAPPQSMRAKAQRPIVEGKHRVAVQLAW